MELSWWAVRIQITMYNIRGAEQGGSEILEPNLAYTNRRVAGPGKTA